VGAAHQTGWTGLIAKLLQPRRVVHPANDTMLTSRAGLKAKKTATLLLGKTVEV
jgi:hypothetical protein